MKIKSIVKYKISNTAIINFLGLLAIIFAIHEILTRSRFTLAITFVVFLSYLFTSSRAKVFWFGMLFLYLYGFTNSYFYAANHHFVFTYIIISILAFLYLQKDFTFLRNCFSYLLAFIMLVAGVQKIISTEFISGNFFYYMLNSGQIFYVFKSFVLDWEIVEMNKELIKSLEYTNPNLYQSTQIKDIHPKVKLVALILTWLTIAAEILAGILFISKPRKIASHIVLITVILGVFFTRAETVFLTSLCLMAALLTENYKLRLFYFVLSCLFVSFSLNYYGFY